MNQYAVGIDVGGTKIATCVLDGAMNLLSVHVTKEHAGQRPAQVVDVIERAYSEALIKARVSPSEVAGVGLSFAGHTDGRHGVVLTSSNMPEWDGVPLRDIVSKRLNKHVILDNDTNFGVVAEHRYGAGRGAADVVYITCSTGIAWALWWTENSFRGMPAPLAKLGTPWWRSMAGAAVAASAAVSWLTLLASRCGIARWKGFKRARRLPCASWPGVSRLCRALRESHRQHWR
jgi:glucokinase